MKNFYFFSFLLFLISIKDINNCELGKYGENCEKECTCTEWSSSNLCSVLEGRCLDCKFGHFGKKCKDICRPECKTNLCCAVKDEDFVKSKKTIKSNVSILKIHIGNYTFNIATDYNRGYPLTIFQNRLNSTTQTAINTYLSERSVNKQSYSFTNYNINGFSYKCKDIYIGDSNNFKLDLEIIMDESIPQNNSQNISGVIGLGFLNSINKRLFSDHNISLNIASYEIKKEKVSILFGDLFKNQKKYVHKLSYCKSLEETSSNIMKCEVDGIKGKSHSDALKLDNIQIEFSLNQDSSFVLNDDERYKNYIKKYYFDNSNYRERIITKGNGNRTYYCFKHSKINKLTDFGFVINNYSYTYNADKFFIENSEECENKYSNFFLEFDNDRVCLTLGKNFFKDSQITIDNEERILYFYTKNVEYFSGDFVREFTSSPSLVRNPFVMSLIFVVCILLLNIFTFLLYFYFKRKKEKTN